MIKNRHVYCSHHLKSLSCGIMNYCVTECFQKSALKRFYVSLIGDIFVSLDNVKNINVKINSQLMRK